MWEFSADIPKNISEQKLNPPAITEIADFSSLYPKEVQEILWKVETKNEIKQLNETFKQEFIEKLKKLPDYKWSKVQEAIEKGTIEIKKIPWRNWYAIYESKVWNLVYITKLDWTKHTNIDKYRTYDFLSNAFAWWYVKYWYSKIQLNPKNWLRELFNKNWEKIDIFSDKYSIATFDAINHMWSIVSEFEEIKSIKEWK